MNFSMKQQIQKECLKRDSDAFDFSSMSKLFHRQRHKGHLTPSSLKPYIKGPMRYIEKHNFNYVFANSFEFLCSSPVM